MWPVSVRGSCGAAVALVGWLSAAGVSTGIAKHERVSSAVNCVAVLLEAPSTGIAKHLECEVGLARLAGRFGPAPAPASGSLACSDLLGETVAAVGACAAPCRPSWVVALSDGPRLTRRIVQLEFGICWPAPSPGGRGGLHSGAGVADHRLPPLPPFFGRLLLQLLAGWFAKQMLHTWARLHP